MFILKLQDKIWSLRGIILFNNARQTDVIVILLVPVLNMGSLITGITFDLLILS